jgi:hypothetical protein
MFAITYMLARIFWQTVIWQTVPFPTLLRYNGEVKIVYIYGVQQDVFIYVCIVK